MSSTTDTENHSEFGGNPINATSSNEMARKYVVEKLIDHNYRMWRTRMELILERTNLIRIVNGSEVIPSTEPDLSDWKSRDLDARMEIIMHLSDRQVDHVRSLGSARAMWDHLKQLHQPSDGTTKIFSYRTLMNMEMREGEPTDTFISNWQRQLDAAISAGNIIDETSKCEILMGSLPESWITFVSIHSNEKDLNLQTLIAKIKQDELRRKKPNGQTDTSHTSHMAMAASMRHHYKGNSYKGNYHKPKTFQKFHPRNKPPQGGAGAITMSTIFCRYCNKPGHLERECRKKQFDQKGKGRRFYPQANNATLQSNNKEYEDGDNNFIQAFMCEMEVKQTKGGFRSGSNKIEAYMAVAKSENGENLWFLDTGATHHLTHNKSLLHNYKALPQALEVRFGDNGTKAAIGKGEVHLSINQTRRMSIPNVHYVLGITKNLLSVSEATTNGTIIEFHSNCAIIKHKLPNGEMLITSCPKLGRLYPLQMMEETQIEAHTTLGNIITNTTLLWHYRLGHLNPKSMKTIQTHKLSEGVPTTPFRHLPLCEGCIFGKQSRQPFPHSASQTERRLQLVHSDLCGPMPTTSLNGNKYFISFIDDHTRFTIIYFLKAKSEAFNAFKTYKVYMENQCQSKINTIRTDNGGEYFSHEWIKFCQEHGIRHQHTVPYTPQQNGVAERKNRTLLDASRSMLQVARLHNQFWQEAIATACYLQNRSPHKALGLNTPYSKWFGHKPNLSHLRVFGATAYGHIPLEKRRKLDPHARKGIFVGYGELAGVKAYKLFDLKTKKFLFSRSVTFDEEGLFSNPPTKVEHSQNVNTNLLMPLNILHRKEYKGPITKEQVQKLDEDATIQKEVTHYHHQIPFKSNVHYYHPHQPSKDEDDEQQQQQSSMDELHEINNEERPSTPTHVLSSSSSLEFSPKDGDNFDDPGGTNKEVSYDNFSHSNLKNEEYFQTLIPRKPRSKRKFKNINELMEITEPIEMLSVDVHNNDIDEDFMDDHDQVFDLTPKKALHGPDATQWEAAMQAEMDALCRNKTWTLVPRPKDRNVISCKWVLTKKTDAHGIVVRFKARVVARGFSQIPGIDFKDTFAPTLKMVPLRLMFSISASLNLELHHLDIETAFLHGDLEEEIYMEQPSHFVDPQFPNYVCKLHKSLYGLKQSPRMWHFKLHTYLVSIGFNRLQAEPNIYIRKDGAIYVIIGVYVDDLPIASNSIASIRKTINQLKEKFPVKDLGPLEYCLGIKVTRNRIEGTLTLTQQKLVDDILQKFEMVDCKPISTPMTVPCKLSTNDSPMSIEEEHIMKTLPYRQILGSIRYLVSCTRPDLSYCAGFLSRFMQNPGLAHWQALKRVLRYLKYTKDMGLTYRSFQSKNSSQLSEWINTSLVGWTDSDWGGDLDTSRSTSGMVFIFGGAAIAWKSKRQVSVALSSTEAEYVAAALTAKEGLWIKTIIEELDIFKLMEMKIFCDNQSCIKLSTNPKITDQNKHIRARHHFIRELVESKEMLLHYTSTTTMWADFLTKPVSHQKHWNCCNKIGLYLQKANN